MKAVNAGYFSAARRERWLKASVLAALWAAFEIVFGSVLHNLKVPFSGNILTGIAIILFILSLDRWPERGIIWRAGLITALLKTLSPSAVIFGPMLAIFMEGLIFDMTLRLIPGRIPGILAASVLAMSWNLLQRILNLLLFYGMRIVDIYGALIDATRRQFDIQGDLTWVPILLLLAGYGLSALGAAAVGLRILSLKEQKDAPVPSAAGAGSRRGILKSFEESSFDYSLPWLFLNITLIAASFYLLSSAPLYLSGLFISGMVLIWSLRYERAVRQLLKRKFWISFILITLLTTWLLFPDRGHLYGLLAGIEMNFRAAAVILGFAVVGTELYHPRIRTVLRQSRFHSLYDAMDLSLSSLPEFIAAVPDLPGLKKYPLSAFRQLFLLADRRLQSLRREQMPRFIVLHGEKGEGKSSFIRDFVQQLRSRDIACSGLMTHRDFSQGILQSYIVEDLSDGSKAPFLSRTAAAEDEVKLVGQWYGREEGLVHGRKALAKALETADPVLILDELGPLELQGEGWAAILPELSLREQGSTVITCRNSVLSDIEALFPDAKSLRIPINELQNEQGFRDFTNLFIRAYSD